MEERVDPVALMLMKKNGGEWAVYQNQALDSHNAGHMQFLRVGKDCTFPEPPPNYPKDTEHGMGWRYLYIGMVDFEHGTVKEAPRPHAESAQPQA